MCKYCDIEVDQCGQFILQGEHSETGTYIYRSADGFFLVNNHDDVDETEIDFCPKCGTPLGEVKPLTAEQLISMVGKHIFISVPSTGEFRKQMFEISSHFCRKCIEAFGYYLYLDELGINWIAYSQEPKGKAE